MGLCYNVYSASQSVTQSVSQSASSQGTMTHSSYILREREGERERETADACT